MFFVEAIRDSNHKIEYYSNRDSIFCLVNKRCRSLKLQIGLTNQIIGFKPLFRHNGQHKPNYEVLKIFNNLKNKEPRPAAQQNQLQTCTINTPPSFLSPHHIKMKIFLLLTLTALAAGADYESVLQSPQALKNLFSEFSSKYNQVYSPQEGPLRLRLFRADLQRVVQLNKEQSWVSGLNMFSAMTSAEKQQYLGLNISRAVPADELPLSSAPSASYLNWREKGKVTGI